jgi:signal transduction histidine kinase
MYVVLFAASALVLGVAVYFVARSALEQQTAARIETEVAFLREEMKSGGAEVLKQAVRLRAKGASALDYLLEDPEGTRLAGDMPLIPLPVQTGWVSNIFSDPSDEGGKLERVRALVALLDDGLVLAVGEDLSRTEELQESIIRAYLWTVGLAILLGIGGGIVLSRAFLRRVDAIARTAEAIIQGDLTQRVPLQGTRDDLDRLADTLNRMLDRIAMLMESLQQVSTDVAHDLRTPLSRLFQHLEHARTHAASLEEYEAAVDRAMREAENLLGTFTALLRIAQVEGASRRIGFRHMDMSMLVEAVVDAYQPDLEDTGHEVSAAIEPEIILCGDKELLTQAVANLVENALRHTPPKTIIRIQLTKTAPDTVLLVIEDNGPGVPAEDLQRVTRRFYRAERSRTTPGNGLGLSLVAAITELHRVPFRLEHNNPGLRATLCFRVSSDETSRAGS